VHADKLLALLPDPVRDVGAVQLLVDEVRDHLRRVFAVDVDERAGRGAGGSVSRPR
jgi:hypothetical protein